MNGKTMFGKILHIAGMAVCGIAFAGVFALIFGYAVMHLWNWIMPDLFGLKTIGYWKALGILILAKIFFGSFMHHSRHDGRCRAGKFKKMKRLSILHDLYHEDEYANFWEEKGAAAFSEYLRQKNSGKEERRE